MYANTTRVASKHTSSRQACAQRLFPIRITPFPKGVADRLFRRPVLPPAGGRSYYIM